MNAVNRLKLWGGVLAVLVVMALLTLLFNQRQNSVASESATIQAPSSQVASAYGGVVVDQLVTQGQQVKAGDRLFVVSSSTLQQTIARGSTPASNLAYDINATSGEVTYKAVTDGTVTDLTGFKGTYVNDGAPLASIVATSGRTVVANYRLAPADYGRIVTGGPVSIFLPNNVKVSGTVQGVSVTMDNGEALTSVTIASQALDDASLGLLGNKGTPVTAVLSLRDDGILAGPTQVLLGFLTKIGLR